MTQIGKIYADQSRYYNDSFFQMFYLDVRMLNRSENVMHITKLKATYKNKEGKEESFVTPEIGFHQSFYNYSWSNDKTITLNGNEIREISLRLKIKLSEIPYKSERRVFKSLPSPFFFNLFLYDQDDKLISFHDLSFVNPPLQIKTEEEWFKSRHSDQEKLFLSSVDNTLVDSRFFASTGVGTWYGDFYLSIYTGNENTYKSENFYSSFWKKLK